MTRFFPMPPSVLVLGGSGAVGAGVVECVRALGWKVTATGRSSPSSLLQERLFDALGVPYESLDLGEVGVEGKLKALLEAHQLVVLACEPWAEEHSDLRDAVAGVARLYALARTSGFEVEANRARTRGEPPRRIVRVGSSAAELPHALMARSRLGWPEDRVTLDAVEALASSDPRRSIYYFRLKVALARAADGALRDGVDLVFALPTYVVSWWDRRGRQEPLVHALNVARSTGFVPSVPVNAVPVDVVARGILRVGLFGAPGERYQLCGVETDTHALHALSLQHVGVRALPFPVPRRELMDEVRLLSGQERRNPWLKLWLLPWDLLRGELLRYHGVEAWHLALVLEGSNRSGEKVRALDETGSPYASMLPYPAEAEIWPGLESAAQRKIEWLLASGQCVGHNADIVKSSTIARGRT
jgi:nucleoside-diphosphate-sugar epimerase